MKNAPATSSAMPLGNDAAGDGFPVDDIDYNLMAGSRYLGPGCTYLLGSVGHGCYRCFMTVFRYDYDLLAGMHTASTVALSCAGTISADAGVLDHGGASRR